MHTLTENIKYSVREVVEERLVNSDVCGSKWYKTVKSLRKTLRQSRKM